MRNINDYVEKYYNEPFEPYMVQIRKNNIIKQLQKYRHVNILEIGCGLSPLFLDFQEFNNMKILLSMLGAYQKINATYRYFRGFLRIMLIN